MKIHLDSLEPRRLCAAATPLPSAVDANYTTATAASGVNVAQSTLLGVGRRNTLILANPTNDHGVSSRVVQVRPDGSTAATYVLEKAGIRLPLAQAADAHGTVVSVGKVATSDEIRVVRLDSALAPAKAFSVDGVSTLLLPTGFTPVTAIPHTAVALDNAGRVVIALSSQNGVVLTRLTARGRRDDSFGSYGFATLTTGNDYFPTSIRLTSAGRILVSMADLTGRFRVAARTDTGAIDTAYATAGLFKLPTAFEIYAGYFIRTAVDDQGRVYLGIAAKRSNGTTLTTPAGSSPLSVVRFLPSGRIDSTFGDSGAASLTALGLPLFTNQFRSSTDIDDIAIDGDGRVIVTTENSVVRLLPDGSADPSFDFDGVLPDRAGGKPIAAIAGEDRVFTIGSTGTIQAIGRPGAMALDTTAGVLRIAAQAKGATLRITTVGRRTRVEMDDTVRFFSTKLIHQFSIQLSDGDDVADIHEGLLLYLDAGNGADHITFTGNGNHQVTLSDNPANVYTGDAGRDVVSGSGTINVGQGKARVRGSNITMTATPIVGGDGEGVTVELFGGNNSVRVSGPVIAYLGATGGVNRVSLKTAVAYVTLSGHSARNIIDTGAGNDVITASYGRDKFNTYGGNDVTIRLGGTGYINGGDGNDSLTGGSGGDALLGEAGDDTLIGGTGADVIFGGDGTDTADDDPSDSRYQIETLLA